MPASRSVSFSCKTLVPVCLFILMLVTMGLVQPARSIHAQPVSCVTERHPHILKTKYYRAAHDFGGLPLEYHNGPVMRATSTSYAIFWLPATLQDGRPTSVSSTYISLISRYFGDIGGSGLYNTATQYSDSGGSIVNSSTLGGVWVDTSVYPPSDCQDSSTPANCMSDTQFQNEVTKAMQVKGWKGGLSNLFYVFTSAGEGSCFDTSLWSYKTGGAVNSTPVFDGGNVYFSSNDGCVYALNASSGALRWRRQIKGAIPSSPVVSGGMIYTGSSTGSIYAFNESNGALRWRYSTVGTVATSTPVVANHMLYVSASNGYIYALNAGNGLTRWRDLARQVAFTQPVIENNIVYVTSTNGLLYALHAANGALLWRFTAPHAVALNAPLVMNGVVYAGANDQYLYAVRNGKLLWRFKTGGKVKARPVINNGVVYVGSDDGYLYTLNASNGAQNWRFQAASTVRTSPVIARQEVFFGSDDYNVYTLNNADGTIAWQFATGGAVDSSPAIAIF